MKHALKYFSSRNVPSLRPNGVCFLTQSGKNIVLLKWKMNTMKNDVLSFTLHCCPITFSSLSIQLSSFHTLDFMSSQGTFSIYLNLKANVYTHFLHINFFHKKCQESLEIWHGDGSCMYKWTVTYNFLRPKSNGPYAFNRTFTFSQQYVHT